MAVRRLSLRSEAPRVDWGVQGLIPRGHVSLVLTHPSQGMILTSFLAVQAARPEGRGFVGERAVRHGRTVLVDAKDPKGWGYTLWISRFLNAYPDADRGRVDLRVVEDLTLVDVEALEDELKSFPPAFLVLDGLASALLEVDVGGPRQAAATLRGLAALAHDLGVSLVLMEEMGRPSARGAFPGGPLGAVLRAASPAVVFALEGVPPREAGGREVMRLVNLVQRYAPLVPPEGLVLLGAREGEGWTLEPYPLPEGQTLVARAEAALLHALREAGEGGLPRKALLEDVVARVDVSERTAKSALANLKARGAVTEVALGGRGNPKAYRLTASKDLFAQNSQNETSALKNTAYFGQNPLPRKASEIHSGEDGPLEPPEGKADCEWEVEL